MTGRSASAITKHAYRLLSPRTGLNPADPNGPLDDEFSESDVWDSPGQLPTLTSQNRSIPTGRYGRKKPEQINVQTGPCSLPVSVPDWSKILGDAHGNHNNFVDSYQYWDEEIDGTGPLIPPHEFLSVNRTVPTSSVQEGIGRTLKGRDLRRVRDAVWESTGFQA